MKLTKTFWVHISICYLTLRNHIGEQQIKCNIAKTTLSENPFLVVNKKTITLDEIDRVELCQPIGIYYKKRKWGYLYCHTINNTRVYKGI